MKKLIYSYIVYIIYFLGIGMTSSGIVLMPFNVLRYSIILGIGLGLFISGSLINEVVINKHKLSAVESLKLIASSLTLAIGIGMISGGISHFKESPIYVSYLIPLGIVISFVSFMIKNNYKLNPKEKTLVVVAVVAVALIVHVVLSTTAAGFMVEMKPGGDIFKGGH